MSYGQIPDVVNANAAVTPALPLPITDAISSGSGTTASSGAGFKAKKGSRSSTRTASRPQNGSKPGTAVAMAADGTDTSKQKQSHVQVEKRNQAIAQLRKLLVQGNKRVEALATVVQHLFSEVHQLFFFSTALLNYGSNVKEERQSSVTTMEAVHCCFVFRIKLAR